MADHGRGWFLNLLALVIKTVKETKVSTSRYDATSRFIHENLKIFVLVTRPGTLTFFHGHEIHFTVISGYRDLETTLHAISIWDIARSEPESSLYTGILPLQPETGALLRGFQYLMVFSN